MILAHRGVHRTAPENTLDAFADAADLGLDGVETDVRLSADGRLVLFHDRTIRGGRPVASLTHRELSRAVGYPVPRLEEALAAHPDLFFDIEVKVPDAAPRVLATLRSLRRTDRIVVTSFFHDRIDELAEGAPVPLGVILSHRPHRFREEFCPYWASRPAVRTLAIDCEYADASVVETARRAGLDVFLWGMLTREEHAGAAALGPVALVTDYPREFE